MLERPKELNTIEDYENYLLQVEKEFEVIDTKLASSENVLSKKEIELEKLKNDLSIAQKHNATLYCEIQEQNKDNDDNSNSNVEKMSLAELTKQLLSK